MTDLLSDYIAAPTLEEEWRVVSTLAASPSPVQTCRAGNWRRELFSEEAVVAAFQRISSAQRPIPIQLPPALDGIALYTDEELRSVRARMARAVLLGRYLPDYQGNLRDRLYTLTQIRPTAERDVESLIKEALDTTLESMDTSLEILRAIVSPLPRETMIAVTQQELDASYWQRIQEQKSAVSTGFGSLTDIMSGGLREGRVYTVLGGPGGGKTTFCNQLAEYVANQGRPVVYVACEEPPATLYAKTLARIGKVSYAVAQFGWASQREAIDRAREQVRARASSRRLLYVEGFSDLPALSEMARTHFQRYEDEQNGGGAGMLVVDYLQVLAQTAIRSGNSQAREEHQLIGLLMYELRLLAKLLKCMVVVISSQSRASGYGNSNPLTSGRGSNFIEYSSDVLISIDKDEDIPLSFMLKQAGFEWRKLALPKNRLGSPGSCTLLWRGGYQEFSEASPVDEEEDDDDED